MNINTAFIQFTNVTQGTRLAEYTGATYSSSKRSEEEPSKCVAGPEKVEPGPSTDAYDEVLNFLNAAQGFSYELFGGWMQANGGVTGSSGGAGGAWDGLPGDDDIGEEDHTDVNSADWSQEEARLPSRKKRKQGP